MVTPLKSNPQAVPRTPPEGYLGEGQVTVMAKKTEGPLGKNIYEIEK